MTLLSFSIPEMIEMIKDGTKHQTTRVPRKPRSNGKSAYSVGDKVQLYYLSRQSPSCKNCIVQPCARRIEKKNMILGLKIVDCSDWTNFLGESEIIEILHYNIDDYKEDGFEFWMEMYIGDFPEDEQDSWAKADGFPDGFRQADHWFKKSTKNSLWAFQPLDVIVWEKKQIIKHNRRGI